MGLRRNIDSLNSTDRQNLISALMGMKQSGVYDDFVRTHVRAMAVATPFGREEPDTNNSIATIASFDV